MRKERMKRRMGTKKVKMRLKRRNLRNQQEGGRVWVGEGEDRQRQAQAQAQAEVEAEVGVVGVGREEDEHVSSMSRMK